MPSEEAEETLAEQPLEEEGPAPPRQADECDLGLVRPPCRQNRSRAVRFPSGRVWEGSWKGIESFLLLFASLLRICTYDHFLKCTSRINQSILLPRYLCRKLF